ncbi:nucleotidyltransferase [Gordonia phage Toniann]|uniref:Nucleotidyltransferase n=1 Tax=Gordonia phage ClubL TaxID=1838065 RepID=A0A160DFD8_9CAUD|nr:nucleotidyltransferase [Gordonia phage ClubL]ANA86635.1 nucleotidyltransferase [Gordonia phage ClubL]AUE23703.1 nucleotidyltransferase [Gordonia phage Toniann]WKW85935.1 nucleotidyltransferase [Gordonia Phage PhinkBoden]
MSNSRQIITAVVGSRLHGNARPDSDTDLHSVHVAPTMSFAGLGPVPQPSIRYSPEHTSWEVGHFCRLAIKGELNTLEVLYAEDYQQLDGWFASGLLDLRSDFLSQRIAIKWIGFAQGQWYDVRDAIDKVHNHNGDPADIKKPAFHLIRVIDALGSTWETGILNPRHPHPDRVTGWIDENHLSLTFLAQLQAVIDAGKEFTGTQATPLPPEPETKHINQYLHNVRAHCFFEEGFKG